jgi:hypothetical protein
MGEIIDESRYCTINDLQEVDIYSLFLGAEVRLACKKMKKWHALGCCSTSFGHFGGNQAILTLFRTNLRDFCLPV